MSNNIFEVWKQLGEKVPFAVRRDTWSNEFYTIVDYVEIKNWPYGIAQGYPTHSGNPTNHYDYDKKWRQNREIPCAGCYQWTHVPEAIIRTHSIKENKPISTVAGGLSNQLVLTENSIIPFGKYKGQSISEIFFMNPSYLKWAIENVQSFVLDIEAFTKLQNSDGGETLDESTAKINEIKFRQL